MVKSVGEELHLTFVEGDDLVWENAIDIKEGIWDW